MPRGGVIRSDARGGGPLTPLLLCAVALKRLDDLEGSERALEKAHSLAPQDPQVLVNYAVVLDAQRRPERVRELLIVLSDVAALTDVDSQVTISPRSVALR